MCSFQGTGVPLEDGESAWIRLIIHQIKNMLQRIGIRTFHVLITDIQRISSLIK